MLYSYCPGYGSNKANHTEQHHTPDSDALTATMPWTSINRLGRFAFYYALEQARKGERMRDYSTKIFDQNGVEIAIGQTVREYHYLTANPDRHFDERIGVIRYVAGCHLIDFGEDVCPLWERKPMRGQFKCRVWEVIDGQY